MGEVQEKKLHIAMYPWFAMGHMTPFLHLANKLAQRGHKVSLFLPPKVHLKLTHLNRHPELISFTTVPVPAVDGLPVGANTTADIPLSAGFLLFDPYDLTQPTIDVFLAQLKPDIVFYDYAHWLPGLAREHRAKSVFFSTTYVSFYAYMVRGLQPATEAELKQPPPGFPSQFFCYRAHEARMMAQSGKPILRVSNMTFPERVYKCIDESDAVCCNSCKEMEGPFGDYFEKHYRKPVLWAGPILPELPASGWLDEKLDGWLKKFEEGSVVYCALGSESVLPKEQFQELVLGLELAGMFTVYILCYKVLGRYIFVLLLFSFFCYKVTKSHKIKFIVYICTVDQILGVFKKIR